MQIPTAVVIQKSKLYIVKSVAYIFYLRCKRLFLPYKFMVAQLNDYSANARATAIMTHATASIAATTNATCQNTPITKAIGTMMR